MLIYCKHVDKLSTLELGSADLILLDDLFDIHRYNFKEVFFLGNPSDTMDREDIRLCKKLYDLRMIFMLEEEDVYLEDMGEVYNLSLSKINRDLLNAFRYNDKGAMEEALESGTVPWRSLRERKQEEELSKLRQELSSLNTQTSSLRGELSRTKEDYRGLVSGVVEFNKSLKLFQYSLAKDLYEKMIVSHYQNPPSIVYFKRYRHFEGIDLFAQTLYNLLFYQYKKSAKIVLLMDNDPFEILEFERKGFAVLSSEYKVSEVITNDILVKVGQYRELMDNLLANQHHLHILVVIDCKRLPDITLQGNLLQFCLTHKEKDIDLFGLPRETTFTNDTGSLVWNPESFEETSNDREKLLVTTSSRPIVEFYQKFKEHFNILG